MRILPRELRVFGWALLLWGALVPSAGAQFGQGGFGTGQFGGSGGFGTGGFGTGGFGSGSGGGGGAGIVVRDTSEIFAFNLDNPQRIRPYRDSLLDDFQQYDPIRQQEFDWAHLGNLGSAARPLFYRPTFRMGFDLGFHQFDLYLIRTHDIDFYRITQAYTDAFFSQGPTQDDAYFKIRFSRNFAHGLNLAIDHRKINNQGAYDFQAAKDVALGTGLWWHAPSGRYDGFFTFAFNTIDQQDNGGTLAPTDTLLPAFQVDVRRSAAQTRHTHREIAYTHYFYLNRSPIARQSPPAQTLPPSPPPSSSVPSGPPVSPPAAPPAAP
ncbi:MAG: hypothetical protein D6765_05765, partial [Bacteroidetes bacterium]